MNLGLEDKVAIVTGGANGIGEAIVEGFVKEGANVIIADINLPSAQTLAERIGGKAKVLAIKIDVTNQSDADNLASNSLKEFGHIDILVNNAGHEPNWKNFVDLEESDWDRVNDVNVKGAYLVTRAVLPHMIAARYGKIINAGKQGQAGNSEYCTSKFAVIGLTQSLAKEMAEYDINVNAICPGLVHTPMWERMLGDLSKQTGKPRVEIFNQYRAQVPLKRSQTSEDMANVVLFLSSEISKNITGESININGGILMD